MLGPQFPQFEQLREALGSEPRAKLDLNRSTGVHRLELETGGTPADPRFNRRLAERGGYVGAQPVGHITWRADTGVVEGVLVDRAHQRKGVGTSLWDMAHHAAAEHGVVPPQHSSTQTDEGAAWSRAVNKRS